MVVKNCKKILSEVRQSRGQITQQPSVEEKTRPSRKRREFTPYEGFIMKFNDLENSIDNLGTRDLVYYFREIAENSGYKYVISNIKKDMAIMKRLRTNYTNREICAMIKFLYMSEQDYLNKDRLSINLLASQWINTIYADMQLWVNDSFVPKNKKKHQSKEWTAPIEENNSSIGEWE